MYMGKYLADGLHVHACLGKIRIISYQDLWQSALFVVIADNHPLDKPVGDAVYNLAPVDVVLRQIGVEHVLLPAKHAAQRRTGIVGIPLDGKEREQHQYLKYLQVSHPAVLALHDAKAAEIQIDVFKQTGECIHNHTATFFVEKTANI